jgi:hypothetical protein
MIDIDSMLTDETFKAIQAKRNLKPDDPFQVRVNILLHTGQVIPAPPVIFDSKEHQRHLMGLLSRLLRVLGATAVTITTDTRYLNTEAFARHFGIPAPIADKQEFFDNYHKIMGQHGGDMSALPSILWNEGLCVIMVGKGIARMAMTHYTVKDGQYTFDTTEFASKGVEVGMIPPWWS